MEFPDFTMGQWLRREPMLGRHGDFPRLLDPQALLDILEGNALCLRHDPQDPDELQDHHHRVEREGVGGDEDHEAHEDDQAAGGREVGSVAVERPRGGGQAGGATEGGSHVLTEPSIQRRVHPDLAE